MSEDLGASGVPLSRGGQTPPWPAVTEIAVAGFQMVIDESDIAANEAAIRRAIDRAADAQADLLVTPEGSLSGYNASFDRDVVARRLRGWPPMPSRAVSG